MLFSSSFAATVGRPPFWSEWINRFFERNRLNGQRPGVEEVFRTVNEASKSEASRAARQGQQFGSFIQAQGIPLTEGPEPPVDLIETLTRVVNGYNRLLSDVAQQSGDNPPPSLRPDPRLTLEVFARPESDGTQRFIEGALMWIGNRVPQAQVDDRNPWVQWLELYSEFI